MRKFIEQWLGIRILCRRIEYLENRLFDQKREVDWLRGQNETLQDEMRALTLEVKKWMIQSRPR